MTEETVFSLDRNHGGIRLVVLLAMFASGVLGLFVLMPAIVSVLRLGGLADVCTTVVGALLLGVGASWLVERLLLRVWPSGRWLTVNDHHLELRRRSDEPVAIAWDDRINVMAWYFVVSRGRTWVPKGWFCLACRLHQDDLIITPYTFMKPEDAQGLPQWRAFEQLVSRKQAPKRGEEHLLKKVTEQGQLRAAEKDRWEDGVEMTPEDFIRFVALVDARVPDWPEPQS